MELKMTEKRVCLAIALSLLTRAVCAAGSTETAIHYFQQKAFSQSQPEFAKAAQAGDTKAQYLLGIGLLQGKYFPKNETEGLRLLRASSDGGNGQASYALFAYLSQDGKHALSETVPLLEKAAAQGDIQGKLMLDDLISRRGGVNRIFSSLDALLQVEATPIAKADVTLGITHGQTVFQKSCAACHQTGIAGAPMMNEQARWTELRKKGLNTLFDHAVNGFKGHPPRGGDYELSGNDIRDALLFMSTPPGS
jgi:cytochrome c5